jgi:hypothetical protein
MTTLLKTWLKIFPLFLLFVCFQDLGGVLGEITLSISIRDTYINDAKSSVYSMGLTLKGTVGLLKLFKARACSLYSTQLPSMQVVLARPGIDPTRQTFGLYNIWNR